MSGIGGQANNMDSINRPTSRVLAPPGGGCSNIFGGGPEPTKAFNKNDPRHKTNNIFGCPEPVQKPTPPAAEPVKADTQPAKIEAPAPTSAIAPTAPVQNPKTQENNPVGVSYLAHLTFNYLHFHSYYNRYIYGIIGTITKLYCVRDRYSDLLF